MHGIDATSTMRILGYQLEEMLVAGGALDEIPALTWPEIKNVLIHLLAGLAHAHARGVIHRDLKPANVLVDTVQDDGTWLPKIADFGLAHLDPDTTLEGAAKSAGTPAYMAPEQISGTLRDHGASTDLYALGCIAYELVAGRPPFDNPHYLAVLQHHLDSPVPPLPDDAIAPPGFESWLARLMLKNPRKRFQHAADAAWALLSLPALETGDTATGERASTPRSTTVLLPTLPWGDGLTTELDRMEGGREPNTRSARPVEVVAPPMPQRWREDHDREVLKRTGVALHGSRPTPLLERREEQRLLWEELRIVRRTGEPRCVVIRGEEGAGKTRLTDWFAAQTEELGIATAMRVQHDRVVTQFHGMPGLFRRYFRIGGMDAEEASLFTPTLFEAVRINMAQALLSIHANEPREAMRYLDRAQPGLATGKVVFTVARDAEHAARQALSLGYEAIADRLAHIAIDHWRGLGRHERAADCEDLVPG